MTAPKRSWSFSLRTIFVVVTVLSCWFCYEFNWLRQRHELVARHASRFEQLGSKRATDSTRKLIQLHEPNWGVVRARMWLFRERPRLNMTLIFVSDRTLALSEIQQAEIERAKRVFPEAAISATIVGP